MDELDELRSPTATAENDAPDATPSALRRVFRNRFGAWRAGWRVAVYLIVLVIVMLALKAGARMLVPDSGDESMMSWGHSLSMLILDIGFILTAWAVLRWFDGRPAAFIGLGFERRWLHELAGGIAIGIVATGGLTFVLVVLGAVSLELSQDVGGALRVMPRYLALFTVAGAAEEFVFRGYLMQALAEGSRRWLAAVLLSLLFAVVHLGNPDVSVVGIANIFLVGLLFAVLYFQTLRLWLPIGFHLSWNWAHGWLWGFDVSGIELDHQLFIATPRGPELVTGGGFGLEGSVLTTALVIVATVWLLRKNVLEPVPELAAVWAEYPRGFGIPPEGDARPTGADDATGSDAAHADGDEENRSEVSSVPDR